MSRRPGVVATQKRKRRNTIIWVAAVAVVIIALMWLEQVALLYVAATLSLVVLLLVVALNDLGEARLMGGGVSAPADDAASLSEGGAAVTASTFGATKARRR